MTEAERAAALADEIEEELTELRKRFKGRENDRFSFAVSFSSWDVIYAALRAYSAPVSTDAGLREAVADVIQDRAQGHHEYGVLNAPDLSDLVFAKIHAGGWRIVPAEPTDAMIKAGVEYRLRTTVTDWYEDTKRLYEVMRDARK